MFKLKRENPAVARLRSRDFPFPKSLFFANQPKEKQMAPHTYEYLQDLRARYIGVNQILFLRGAQPEFEDLTWDLGKISPLLSEVRSNLGQLLEQSDQSDISTIGEVSTWRRVFSEVTNHEHCNSEGVAEMMADAMLCRNQPLTKQTLCDWHYRMFFFDETRVCVFPIGGYRGLEEGPLYFQDTGFVCTEPERIEEEMDKFLAWFNGESSKQIDPLLRVAISSLWFLAVHPFGNGNGRISRAIAEMALAQVDPHIQQSCSIARQLMIEDRDYFLALGKAQTGTPDVTEYLTWFLVCLNRAVVSKNARPEVLKKFAPSNDVDKTGNVTRK
jgi:Fic family protein